MKYLQNKKILLTGASGGFGAVFIRQLLQKGAHLVLSDLNQESLDSLKAPTGASGKIIGTVCADLSKPENFEAFHSDVLKASKNASCTFIPDSLPKPPGGSINCGL